VSEEFVQGLCLTLSGVGGVDVKVVKPRYEAFAIETIHSLNNIYWMTAMSVIFKSSINSVLSPPSRTAKSLDNPNQKPHSESKTKSKSGHGQKSNKLSGD
jgi:hypothetical protein